MFEENTEKAIPINKKLREKKRRFDFTDILSILRSTNAVQIIRQKLSEQSGSFYYVKFDFFPDFPILQIMFSLTTIITKKILSPLG